MNWEKIDQVVNGVLNRTGLSLKRFPGREQRRLLNYLSRNKIVHVLDVGANEGQFGEAMFKSGFEGSIISFEPQSSAFAKLQSKATFNNWKAFHFALGDFDGASEINISGNSVSSSLLDILPTLAQAAPESTYIAKEKITIRKLESLYQEIIGDHRAFLKIDTQGFEMNVLKGAEGVLDKIAGIQLEMSMVPLYANEVLFDEMKSYIESKGFYISSLENGFVEEATGRLLQVDSTFLR